MYFEQFEDISTSQKNSLLGFCKEAEKLIFVRPNYAVFTARQALEVLCASLLDDDGRSNNGILFDMIDTCYACGRFTEEIKNTAHKLRLSANAVVHNGKYNEAINNLGTNYAFEVVRDLYSVMKRVFKKKEKILAFNPINLPIGEYCIVRTVKKSPFELRNVNISGKEMERDIESYNYIAKHSGRDSEYVYIKSYNKNDSNNPFYNRTEQVIDTIRRSRIRDSFVPIISRIDTDSNCDRSYVAYPIYEDSEVLFEHREGFTLRQSIAITLDIICTIEVMNQMKLIYRNVNPYSIVISPFNGIYQAMLVNMETVRNENNNATIYGAVREFYKENVFIHPSVRNIDLQVYDGSKIAWDKASAYSCMVLFAYCAAPDSIRDMDIDIGIIDDLLRDYPELDELCFFDTVCDVFDSALNDIPSLSSLREMFESALKMIEE